MESLLWTPRGLDEASQKVHQRMGSFPLEECASAPHYWEACQLQKRLKLDDEQLWVRGWYGPDGFRWTIEWVNREGAALLVRTIETDDEQYEQPGERWRESLRKHDMWGKTDYDRLKLSLENERRQEREEKEARELAEQKIAEKTEKLYRDAGWSQREWGDDVENFSFAYGTSRGRRPD